MRSQSRIYLSFIALFLLLGPVCYGATITGTVKGPDGAAFQGAFVEAQNAKTKITVIVLSNNQGKYSIPNLPAGDYKVQIRAVGFRVDAQNAANLSATQNTSMDFALQKGLVRWSDISEYQSRQLWPAGKGKDLVIGHCSICHGYETRMAAVRRDEDGWKDRVNYMRTAMHYSIFLGPHLNDQEADEIATYLTKIYGPDSILPKSPADSPDYQKVVKSFSNDAMNIVYVEYDMNGPGRMPFSAAPDKDGYLWIPNFSPANMISRLDPKTGEMKDFPTPNVGTTSIHSAVPAPDGSVWLTEQAANKIAKWDPKTQKITEYQDAWIPGKEGIEDGGSKHTLRPDSKGNIWSSGDPLTKFDPETGKFTRFEELTNIYDVKPVPNGDVWFTQINANKIGKVDGKTMKVTEWESPTTNSGPRRMEVDSDGIVWSGEFRGNKMIRFDPKTQNLREIPLPGPDASPYGMGIGPHGSIWYDSHTMDTINRLDPKTEKVTEYPFPHSEITMREFFRDSQGRMWYGTSANNKVGYFYLADKDGNPIK